MPHLIPKRVFQVFILLLFFVCLALTFYWIFSDSGLYHTLRLWTGEAWKGVAMFLTFFTLFAFWLIIVLPLRALTDLPPMKLREGSGSFLEEVKQQMNLERAKNAELYRAKTYTPELKQRARRNGLMFFLAGLMVTPAILLTMSASLEQGHLLNLQVAVFITGILLVVVGLLQMITGRSIDRRR